MNYQPKVTESVMNNPDILPIGKKAGVGMHFASLAGPAGSGANAGFSGLGLRITAEHPGYNTEQLALACQ